MMNSGKIVEHNINYSSTNIEENDRKFLSNIALRVHNSGLVTTAVYFLEMTKPISFSNNLSLSSKNGLL